MTISVTPWGYRRAIQRSRLLSSTTKLVLLNLSIYMDRDGSRIYPSTKRQARDTSLSERSVCTHLEVAEVAGFIRKCVKGNVGLNWKLHEYVPIIPEGAEIDSVPNEEGAEPPSEPEARGTERNSVRNCEDTEHGGSLALKEVQSNTTVTTSIKDMLFEEVNAKPRQPKGRKRKTRVYTEPFNAFWHTFPQGLNPDKALAFDQWEILMDEGISPDSLMQALEIHKAIVEEKKTKPEWRKRAHTWLGGRVWEALLSSNEPEAEPDTTWSSAKELAGKNGDSGTTAAIMAAVKAGDYSTANKIGSEYLAGTHVHSEPRPKTAREDTAA